MLCEARLDDDGFLTEELLRSSLQRFLDAVMTVRLDVSAHA